MTLDKDKREYNRFEPLKEIYTIKYSMEVEIGFIVDISKSGVKLLIEKNEVSQLGSTFTFRTHLPAILKHKHIDIPVRQAWKTNEAINGYQEIGCYFEELSDNQKALIHQLVDLYETLRTGKKK